MNQTYVSPDMEIVYSVPSMLCISPLSEGSSTDGYSYDDSDENFE